MPKKQIRLNLSDAQWLTVQRQQQLGGYRSIANTIEAQVIIYQESFTAHLSAPYLPQLTTLLPQVAPRQVQSATHQPTSVSHQPTTAPQIKAGEPPEW